jgi:plasmid stabilization system protein ParE
MTESGRRVLHLGMLLSREERVEVAARLVQSVNAIAEAESAWLAIIARRAAQLVAGASRVVESDRAGGIRVDVEAEADIEQAVSWYEENRPEEVSAFLSEVAFAFRKIRRKPDGYGRLEHASAGLDVRRIYLRNLPYALAFTRWDGGLNVLAVAHTYRRPFEQEITVSALIAVEDWLAAQGLRLRAIALMAVGA